MTIAVDLGRKATKQTKERSLCIVNNPYHIMPRLGVI